MDHMNHDLKCLNHNWVVEGLESVKQGLNEGIKQSDQFFPDINLFTSSWFVCFVSLKDQTVLIKSFLQSLETEVSKNTTADFLGLPVRC